MISELIETIISELSRFVITCISKFGYTGILLTMAIESACIPLPSEMQAIEEGVVSITPIQLDSTHHDVLDQFREWEQIMVSAIELERAMPRVSSDSCSTRACPMKRS